MQKTDSRLTDDIDEAVRVLQRGGLVAFPTETVYGLGADARNPEALDRLYEAKGRPRSHPVIVHIGDPELVLEWASRVSPAARSLAEAFWPGPLTLILPRAEGVLDKVTGGQETVGLRVPDHPVALRLLAEFGGGIAAPSANRFGRLSPTRAEHVMHDLRGRVDLVLRGGATRVGLESTIVNLSGDSAEILRPGHITEEQIAAVLGRPVSMAVNVGTVRAAGTLPSHYAPDTPLRIVSREELAQRIHEGPVAVLARMPGPADLPEGVDWLQAPEVADEYARHLYANLRQLDARGADAILVEAVPNEPAWNAIQDRLKRAAGRG